MATATLLTRPVTGASTARDLHPWAWWAWAGGVAVAASLSTQPLFLVVLAAAVLIVVLRRRGDTPWGRAIWAYLLAAVLVVAIRVFFVVLLGSGSGTTVIAQLPQVDLPAWAAGVSLGGPVHAEPVLGGAYDAMRLGLVLIAVGAANAVANPKRALRALPNALRDLSTAVVIAVTTLPQLVRSTIRVRRARTLRGTPARGFAAFRTILVPVLEDAVERSMALAHAMEARGFGRSQPGTGRLQAAAVLSALLLVAFGAYLTLAGQGGTVAIVVLAVGVVASVAALVLNGRRITATRYRPDPWLAPEWVTAGTGALAAALASWWAVSYPSLMHAGTTPLQWPSLPVPLLAVAVLIAAPALLTPEPASREAR